MESRSAPLEGVTLAMLIASWLMVVLRFYVRLKIKPSLGWDDGLLFFTLVIVLNLGSFDESLMHQSSMD